MVANADRLSKNAYQGAETKGLQIPCAVLPVMTLKMNLGVAMEAR